MVPSVKRSAVTLIAIASMLAIPAAASARHWSPIQAAYTVAARHWHEQPCSGHIKIVVEAPWANDAAKPAGISTSMWASWDVGTPWENREDAPLPFTGCTIGIDSDVWRSADQEGREMWPDFAIDMVHEFDHLRGHGDLFDPADSASIDYIMPSDNIAITGEYAPGWR